MSNCNLTNSITPIAQSATNVTTHISELHSRQSASYQHLDLTVHNDRQQAAWNYSIKDIAKILLVNSIAIILVIIFFSSKAFCNDIFKFIADNGFIEYNAGSISEYQKNVAKNDCIYLEQINNNIIIAKYDRKPKSNCYSILAQKQYASNSLQIEVSGKQITAINKGEFGTEFFVKEGSLSKPILQNGTILPMSFIKDREYNYIYAISLQPFARMGSIWKLSKDNENISINLITYIPGTPRDIKLKNNFHYILLEIGLIRILYNTIDYNEDLSIEPICVNQDFISLNPNSFIFTGEKSIMMSTNSGLVFVDYSSNVMRYRYFYKPNPQ